VSLGRRKVGLDEPDRWVFNRMADAYSFRPSYPDALIEAIAQLARGPRVIDLGAGIGHVALPLARRGLEVTAVEPAHAMLDRLGQSAARDGIALTALHATAESLPLSSACADLVVIADALHFIDAERTGSELARVLASDGALAIVTAELGDTAFMRRIEDTMREHAPRRPRQIEAALSQVEALAGTQRIDVHRFDSSTAVDDKTLEGILRSISFIGPAMNAERFEAFRAQVMAIEGPREWARKLTLYASRRSR
jgi:ubiquinone/menaquinone biosynthesis C-methylase UbiE